MTRRRAGVVVAAVDVDAPAREVLRAYTPVPRVRASAPGSYQMLIDGLDDARETLGRLVPLFESSGDWDAACDIARAVAACVRARAKLAKRIGGE